MISIASSTSSIRTSIGRGLLIVLLLSLAGCHDDSPSYRLAGRVSGQTGDGLVLVNNGLTSVTVPAGANSFSFPGRIRKGGRYNVTVSSQPGAQICTVTNGSGTVRGNVTDIQVACSVKTQSVAGSITGLGADGLVLQLNGADDLALPANAQSFEFATPIAAGSGYHVTVLTQPVGLVCTVNNGAASNINADIDSVQVVCSATTHHIGGTITGLVGAGLVLQNNGADDLTVSAGSSSFQFSSASAYGGAYSVTVLAQPAGQTCAVLNGSGVAQSNVTNVALTCSNILTYTIVPSAGANGSISPNVPVLVNQGGDITFVATPDVGYSVSQWLVDGAVAQAGGSTYALSNVSANGTVQVQFGSVVLSASTSTLALSVNDTGTNAALTGSPRTVTITNTGSIAATSVSVAASSLPSGTTVSPSACGVIAPGSSCVVTITPGSIATSSCTTGIAPTPSTLTISADNASSIAIDVLVLGYGCIYQGGYVFAVDDTTPATSSIGGKVAAAVDQSPAYPNGIIWSSNGAGGSFADADLANVGVAESSVSPCVGSYDGACNSSRILSHYPSASYPRHYFAAGQCVATIAGYSDWYLPAACEATACGVQQNMQSNLVEYNNLSLLTGVYWTSTEASYDPVLVAISAQFDPLGGSAIGLTKNQSLGVRCARALSQ